MSVTTVSPSNFFRNGNRFIHSVLQAASSPTASTIGLPTITKLSKVGTSCNLLNSTQSFIKLLLKYSTFNFFNTCMPFSFSIKL